MTMQKAIHAGRFIPVQSTVRGLLLAAAMSACCAATAATGAITCEGMYDGHLQGTDAAGTNVWWSFTTTLVRTDLSGRVLASRIVPRHHGDLCVKGDTLYVAVNLGRFNRDNGGKSCVMSYDAMTLVPGRTWNIDMPYGAGGMTCCGDRFYVVGGLPPTDGRNYVHEFDTSFRLIKRHVLHTGYTLLGIQTAAFIDGEFLFGIYGGNGNPSGTLRCPQDLSSFRRYVGSGSVGYAKIGGRIYTASTPTVKTERKRWTGTLLPEDRLLADAKLFSSPWYSNGVLKGDPMRIASISLGAGDGKMRYASRSEWNATTKRFADEGFNAIIIDIADGYAYPTHPEVAAKGAWGSDRLAAELRRLRDMGLEPIPSLDFSSGRCAWAGKNAETSQARARCVELITDARKAFESPRFFQVIADGRPSEDRESFRAAVISNGYGCCPWPLDRPESQCLTIAK